MARMSKDGYAPKSMAKPFHLLKQAMKWGGVGKEAEGDSLEIVGGCPTLLQFKTLDLAERQTE